MKALLSFAIFQVLIVSASLKAEDRPEYLKFFDPAKGFKPAQRNLTDIYLQIAGSLECYGSPAPYLRQMQAEHERIAKLLSAQAGHPVRSTRPVRMTDEYIAKLVENWNKLSPVLHLDELAKAVGEDAREGIRGTRDNGTVLVEIFNEHQKKIFNDLARSGPRTISFNDLRTEVTTRMEMNREKVSLIGYRVQLRDAVSYALVIKGRLEELNAKLDKALPPEKARPLESAITGAFIDLAEMGQSELEAAIQEWSIK